MDTRNLTINVNDTDDLERLGDALSSGYRVKILQLLSQRSYSTQELLEILKISPSTLSFHLKILTNDLTATYDTNAVLASNFKITVTGVYEIRELGENQKEFIENLTKFKKVLNKRMLAFLQLLTFYN